MSRTTIILNMSNIGPESLTGPGHHAVRLFDEISQLIERGDYDVELLGFVQNGAAHHFSESARDRLRFLPRFRGRVIRTIHEQIVLPFKVKALKPDILLNTAFTGPLWGAKRIVTIVHDLYFRVVPSMVEPKLQRFLSVFVPLCGRRSWKVLTISRSSANDIEHYYPFLRGKVAVALLGSKYTSVSPHASSPPDADPPYFLMVANMTANKNAEVVVSAVSDYRRRHGPVRLVHVGADKLGLLASATVKHDAATWVSHETGISDARLAELYRGATALIVASFYEGFCMPVLEGQSLGVPVICSNRSALPEVAGDAALYFDPDRPEELVSHMDALLTDDGARARLVAAGHANVARFSWEKTARETLRHLGVGQIARSAG